MLLVADIADIILIRCTSGVGPKKRRLMILRGCAAIVVTLMIGRSDAAAVKTVFGP